MGPQYLPDRILMEIKLVDTRKTGRTVPGICSGAKLETVKMPKRPGVRDVFIRIKNLDLCPLLLTSFTAHNLPAVSPPLRLPPPEGGSEGLPGHLGSLLPKAVPRPILQPKLTLNPPFLHFCAHCSANSLHSRTPQLHPQQMGL